MPRPNLLTIDDVLLRTGFIACFAWLLGTVTALALAANDSVEPRAAIVWTVVSASAPLGLLFAGFKLRRRENRAWALHRLVDDHVELSASDLLRDSDFTRESLDRAIRDLNNSGSAYLAWDRQADVIQDGRLRSTRVEVEVCDSCGAKVSLNVRVGDIASTRCPYCHDPLGAERLMEEKAELIDTLDTDPEILRARNQRSSNFSIPIFLILTFVFWPLGLGYAFWKWRAGQVSV